MYAGRPSKNLGFPDPAAIINRNVFSYMWNETPRIWCTGHHWLGKMTHAPNEWVKWKKLIFNALKYFKKKSFLMFCKFIIPIKVALVSVRGLNSILKLKFQSEYSQDSCPYMKHCFFTETKLNQISLKLLINEDLSN